MTYVYYYCFLAKNLETYTGCYEVEYKIKNYDDVKIIEDFIAGKKRTDGVLLSISLLDKK